MVLSNYGMQDPVLSLHKDLPLPLSLRVDHCSKRHQLLFVLRCNHRDLYSILLKLKSLWLIGRIFAGVYFFEITSLVLAQRLTIVLLRYKALTICPRYY